jgi:hypothetical protein
MSRAVVAAVIRVLEGGDIRMYEEAYRQARKQVVRPRSEMDERTSKKPDHRL